jgi:hypothetical protein
MTTLVITARTNDSITVTIGAGGGETAFELEVNRAADFGSDESLSATYGAAGAKVIAGLPAGTPFYFRARKTNAGNGAWTAAVMTATLPPDAAGGWAAPTIDPAILVVPEKISTVTCAGAEAGSDPLNLLDDDPMAVLRATGTPVVIEFCTAGRPVDTIALMGTMCSDTATIAYRSADTQANLTAAPTTNIAAAAFRASAGLGQRPCYHSFKRLGAAVATPWWRLTIAHLAPEFIARSLVVGLARQSVNYSRGAGQGFMDLGNMGRNRFGTPDRTRGWRGRQVDFGLSWISEAEFEAKWQDLDLLVGGTDPVFVLPNAKANPYLHDRMALGAIAQTRAEVMRSSKHQRTIEVSSIY